MKNISERISIRVRQNELSNLIRNISDFLSEDGNELPSSTSRNSLSKDEYLETLLILEKELKNAASDASTLRDLVFNVEQLKSEYQKIKIGNNNAGE